MGLHALWGMIIELGNRWKECPAKRHALCILWHGYIYIYTSNSPVPIRTTFPALPPTPSLPGGASSKLSSETRQQVAKCEFKLFSRAATFTESPRTPYLALGIAEPVAWQSQEGFGFKVGLKLAKHTTASSNVCKIIGNQLITLSRWPSVHGVFT